MPAFSGVELPVPLPAPAAPLMSACQAAVEPPTGRTAGQHAPASVGGQPAAGSRGPGQAVTGAAALGSTAGGGAGSSGHACGIGEPRPLCLVQLRHAALGWHLQEVSTARHTMAPPSSPATWPQPGRVSCCRHRSTSSLQQRTWARCGSARSAQRWLSSGLAPTGLLRRQGGGSSGPGH